MTIAYGFNGALYAGHSLNGLTIAPNRAGTIMGLTNGFGSIAGIFVPLVKSAIVKSPADCAELISRWRIVFVIPAVIYTTVAILFVIIGSGEVQEYDKKVYKKKFCAVY
ncbi:putative inorganic phosphate cotransporter isoform X2 [Eurytemora carolleeae]|nr:putative inorganic phosphate cotransporter isoform X2 [Eurytemora carolleeae]|eukprot:XP_023342681.1 putative inorganic phosphate cotransporter isoform X2 [Eurytemora affinis]